MSNTNPVRGDAHVTSTLRWGGTEWEIKNDKNEMSPDVGGGGLASVLDVQSLFFY